MVLELVVYPYVIDIHQSLYAVSFLTESLFNFLFLISVFFLCKGLKEDTKLKFLFISAFTLGISTLIRPISIFFPVVSILLIFLNYKRSIKTRLIYSLLFGTIFIATISPWLLYNYSKTETSCFTKDFN